MILHDTAIISRQPPFPGESENVDYSLHHVDILDTPNFGDHCDKSEERREQSTFSLTVTSLAHSGLPMMPSHVDNLHTFTTCARQNTFSQHRGRGSRAKITNQQLLSIRIFTPASGSALLLCLQLCCCRFEQIQSRTRQRHTRPGGGIWEDLWVRSTSGSVTIRSHDKSCDQHSSLFKQTNRYSLGSISTNKQLLHWSISTNKQTTTTHGGLHQTNNYHFHSVLHGTPDNFLGGS